MNRQALVAVVATALLVAACAGGEAAGPTDAWDGVEPGRLERAGEFEVWSSEPVEFDDGVLLPTATDTYLYHRSGTTICRRSLERDAERCVTDGRLAEADVARRWAAESIIAFDEPWLGHGDGRAMVVNIETGEVTEPEYGTGGLSAVSADGSLLLWLFAVLPDADLTITDLDGTVVESLDPELSGGGGARFGLDGRLLWLHGGRQTLVYDRRAEAVLARFDLDPMMWVTVQPDSGAGVAVFYHRASNLDFGHGAMVFADAKTGTVIPLPAPESTSTAASTSTSTSESGLNVPVAVGLAPDGSHVVMLWERSDPEPVTELHMVPIDRAAGTAGPAEVVQRFNPPLALGWPFEAEIVVSEDGGATWLTRDRLMLVNLGAAP